jgi:hypothetical protein
MAHVCFCHTNPIGTCARLGFVVNVAYSGAAALDRAHHLELAEAHMAAVGATPSGPVIAEDVRDCQSWTGHGWRRLRRRVLVPNQ